MGHFEHGHFYTCVDKKGALFSFATCPPCQPAGYGARGYLLQDLLLPLPALHRPHVAEAPGEARVDLGRPVEVRRPRELPGGRYESDYPRPAATRSSSRIARQDLAKRSGPIAGGRKIQPGSGKPCGPASLTPFIATRTARGQATRRIRNRLYNGNTKTYNDDLRSTLYRAFRPRQYHHQSSSACAAAARPHVLA